MSNVFERLRKTSRAELTAYDITYLHLSEVTPHRILDFSVGSTLQLALESMAATSVNTRTKNLASPMCAFAALDQIGSCYAFTGKARMGGSGIKGALHQFCDIPFQSDDSYALYALRNSLMHDACLTSTLKGKPDRHYYFWYSDEIKSLVQRAVVPWDGNPANLREQNMTWINPSTLQIKVQSGIESLRTAFEEDPLSVVVLQTPEMIGIKYLRWININELDRHQTLFRNL